MSSENNQPVGCPRCKTGWMVDLRAKYGTLPSWCEESYCLNCGYCDYGRSPELLRLASTKKLQLASDLVRKRIPLHIATSDDAAAALHALPAGHAFTVPDVTFRKITDAEREEWQTRFSGRRD